MVLASKCPNAMHCITRNLKYLGTAGNRTWCFIPLLRYHVTVIKIITGNCNQWDRERESCLFNSLQIQHETWHLFFVINSMYGRGQQEVDWIWMHSTSTVADLIMILRVTHRDHVTNEDILHCYNVANNANKSMFAALVLISVNQCNYSIRRCTYRRPHKVTRSLATAKKACI